jgi:hypothetical protein
MYYLDTVLMQSKVVGCASIFEAILSRWHERNGGAMMCAVGEMASTTKIGCSLALACCLLFHECCDHALLFML